MKESFYEAFTAQTPTSKSWILPESECQKYILEIALIGLHNKLVIFLTMWNIPKSITFSLKFLCGDVKQGNNLFLRYFLEIIILKPSWICGSCCTTVGKKNKKKTLKKSFQGYSSTDHYNCAGCEIWVKSQILLIIGPSFLSPLQILANVIIFLCGNMAGAYHKHLMELALKQTYQDTCNCIKSPIKLEFEKRQQV